MAGIFLDAWRLQIMDNNQMTSFPIPLVVSVSNQTSYTINIGDLVSFGSDNLATWYYGYEPVDEIIDPVAEEENLVLRIGKYKLRSSGREAIIEMYNYDSVTIKFLDDKSEVVVPVADFDKEFIKN